MKKLYIICVCGFGSGSSMILKIKVDEVLRENGIICDIDPQDVTSATSTPADIVFTSREISSQLIGKVKCPLVIVDNFLSKDEIKEKGLELVKELMAKKA